MAWHWQTSLLRLPWAQTPPEQTRLAPTHMLGLIQLYGLPWDFFSLRFRILFIFAYFVAFLSRQHAGSPIFVWCEPPPTSQSEVLTLLTLPSCRISKMSKKKMKKKSFSSAGAGTSSVTQGQKHPSLNSLICCHDVQLSLAKVGVHWQEALQGLKSENSPGSTGCFVVWSRMTGQSYYFIFACI